MPVYDFRACVPTLSAYIEPTCAQCAQRFARGSGTYWRSMSDTEKVAPLSPATDADGKLLLSGAEADALLRECFTELSAGLMDLVQGSIDSTNDLFEMN